MAEPFLQIAIKGLEDIQAFQNFESILEEYLMYSMGMSANRLLGTIQTITDQRFAHPTGALSHQFARPFPTIYSEHLPVMSAALIFDSPYALRRNYGFSGMTDSLGRTFTSDPGIFYAEDALIEDRDWIKKNFQKNVNAALRELTKRDAIAASDAAVATSSIPGVP
jgi:hypothetical protein